MHSAIVICICALLAKEATRDVYGQPEFLMGNDRVYLPPQRHVVVSNPPHSSSSRVLLQIGLPQCPSQCASGACKEVGTSGTYFCHQCTNSYVVDYSSGNCACPPGRYAEADECVSCPLDYYCPGTIADSLGKGKIQCKIGLTTRKIGASSVTDCVNAPGHFYVNSTQADPCPVDTYTAGRAYQRSCTPCPNGFYTAGVTGSASAAACKLRPGYFLAGPGEPAMCPHGSYNAGSNMAATCTKCPTGVTTKTAGAATAAECLLLRPGYEAVQLDAQGAILQAQSCHQNAYCPGTNETLSEGRYGDIPCPGGRWTRTIRSTSVNECLVAPGYYWPIGAASITKCPPGTYKSGWTSKQTMVEAACTVCGTGISTEDREHIPRVNLDGSVGEQDAASAVAATSASCYIKPGMEMLRVYNSGSGTLSWIGRACNAKDQPCGVKKSGDMLYAANCSSYGASSNQYGLAIRPCKLCEGLVMNKDSETDGYTTCIPMQCAGGLIPSVQDCLVPAGYAAVTAGLGVIFSVVSNLTEVIRIQPCPAYFYCPGGSPLTSVGLPYPCPDFLRSAAGAKQLADCNEAAPGYSLGAGIAVGCPNGYYKPDWGSGACTPCGANPYQSGAPAGTAFWESVTSIPIAVYTASSNTTQQVFVRGGVNSCYLQPGMGTTGTTPESLTAVYCNDANMAGLNTTLSGSSDRPCFTCTAPGGTRSASGYGFICTFAAGYDLVDGFIQACPLGFYRSNSEMACTACAGGQITIEAASVDAFACIAPNYASAQVYAAHGGVLLQSKSAGDHDTFTVVDLGLLSREYGMLVAIPDMYGRTLTVKDKTLEILIKSPLSIIWSVATRLTDLYVPSLKRFTAIAASPLASKIVVAQQNDLIIISSDGGESWPLASTMSGTWSGLAMSSSGQIIIAVQSGTYSATSGRMYRSIDYGITWSEVTPTINDSHIDSWGAVTCSSICKHAVAVQAGGSQHMFVSSDYGATWNLADAQPPNGPWQAVAMSGNGTNILAAQSGMGAKLHIGLRTGSMWAWSDSGSVTGDWKGVSMTFDGSVMLAASGGTDGRVYQHKGGSWTDVTPGGVPQDWSAVSITPYSI